MDSMKLKPEGIFLDGVLVHPQQLIEMWRMEVKARVDFEKIWGETLRINSELREELYKYSQGYKGGCYACETVGERNIKLEEENEILRADVKSLREELEMQGIE